MDEFHAWTGNIGVYSTTLTLLRPNFTPRVEIKGSNWAFPHPSLTFSSQDVNFDLGIPTHQYFHSSLIKKYFFKENKNN